MYSCVYVLYSLRMEGFPNSQHLFAVTLEYVEERQMRFQVKIGVNLTMLRKRGDEALDVYFVIELQ